MNPPTVPPVHAPPPRIVLPLLLAVLGVFGMSAVWTMVALIFDRQCAWLAVVAAADIAMLLRLGRAKPGMARAAFALVATMATILIANWSIAAMQMGGPMGLPLVDSLQRMGTDLARTLLDLANQSVEWAWYGMAAILAVWLGR
jgi:hypothetical protein